MQAVKNNLTTSPVLRIVLTFVLAFSCVGSLIPAQAAYAAGTVDLNVTGDYHHYGGYGTAEMYADDAIAYCAEPDMATPSSGSYGKYDITPKNASRADEVSAVLWYSYGAPGFDKSMWPSVWYDGSAMTASNYISLAHVLLSDTYASSFTAATVGCSEEFKTWARYELIGQEGGNVTNANATAFKVRAGMSDVPSTFETFELRTGDSTQVVISYIKGGYIDLTKVSSNTAITSSNSCYSLSGAVYGIYSDSACKNLLETMTTNASGYAKSGYTSAGSFYVKEITAPKGYALDTKVYTVIVKDGATTKVNGGTVSDVPQNDPAYMFVGKIDRETTRNMPQGSASLAGAEFTVKYYAGYYSTTDKSWITSTTPTRTWVVKTDSDGFAALDPAYKVSGDAFYYHSGGDVTIPLGTVTIQETQAPEGYLLDDATVYVQQVTSEGVVETIGTYNAPIAEEQVKRGGVSIQKLDLETMLNSPLGGASVDGAQFEIISDNDNAVVVDDVSYDKGKVVKTITTENGVAQTDADTLPYGHYTIREILAPEGYLLTDMTQSFSIVEDGVIVELTGENAIANQVKRGDLEFVKVEDGTLARMAGIPFEITSVTTGESHVIVTDANGYANTASSWNPHSQNTSRGETAEDGVWFGLAADGTMAAVDDSLGALPYDTYVITELPCENNKDKELLSFEIVISRNNVIVKLGTLTNDAIELPMISTYAYDKETESKNIVIDGIATIIDTVTYTNLEVGKEYTMSGVLMDKATGEALLVDGEEICSQATFTPTSKSGTVDVEFTFDLASLAKTDLVVFEKLYIDDEEVATHEDIEDEGQTVSLIEKEEEPVISISTYAYDKETESKSAIADDEVTIVDTVTYENLTPGKEYTMSGVLMDKATNEALLIDGKEVASEITFTPKEANGTVDVEFTFNATALAGTSVVVFETLIDSDKVVATHEDIEDEGQTVDIVAPEETPPGEKPYAKTGDIEALLPYIIGIILVGAIAGVSGYVLFKRRRKSNEDTIDNN